MKATHYTMSFLDWSLVCCVFSILLTNTEAQSGVTKCSIPQLPIFATYNYTMNQIIYPETIVEYDCKINYELNGSKYRKCMQDGTWMPDMPTCVAKNQTCPYPGHGTHMSLTEEQFFYMPGSKLLYSCDPGYILVGHNVRECFPNGTWYPEEPFCGSKLSLRKNIVAHSAYVDINESPELKGTKILDDSSSQCSTADLANRQKPYWKIDFLEELEVDVVILIFGNYLEITVTLFSGKNITDNTEIVQTEYNLTTWNGRIGQSELSTLEFRFKKPIYLRFLRIDIEPITTSRLHFCEALVLSKKEQSYGSCYSDKLNQFKDTTTAMLRKQCYSFPHSTEASFMVAQSKCKELRNGSLVTDVDEDIEVLLELNLAAVQPGQVDKSYWIGGNQEPDAKGRLRWFWTNKHEIKNFYWASGQPDLNNGELACLSHNGKLKWRWDDRTCDYKLNFICQHAYQKCGLPDSKELCMSNEMTDTSIGAIASYACPKGYIIEGDERRRCLPDGSWSGTAPYCVNKTDTGTPEKQSNKNSGLPAGAIAAIVIGIVLSLIIILLVIFFVMYKKKSGSAQIKYSKESERAEVLDAHEKKGAQNYAATDDSNK